LKAAITILPATWSRERRSAVSIAIAVFGLVAFLWLMAIPLSWMPEPIGSAAIQFAEGARVTVALTIL
jgi:polar amino acid transport system permease protein